MMLRCPSCGVRLRLKDETAAARSAAKCPQCSSTVPLSAAQDGSVIKVQCGSCGARLKAPAGSEGTKSACPKCRAEVAIGPTPMAPLGPMAPSAPLAARPRQEESSGVSTRRIDSRTLGMAGMEASSAPAGDIDLDAFVKSKERQAIAGEKLEGFDSSNLASSLMQPPVKELERLAGEIRLAAASFDPAAVHAPAAATETPGPKPFAARETHAPRPARPAQSAPTQSFPASRGLLLGTMAGLLVGSVSAAAVKLAGVRALNYVAPLPLAGNDGGLPDVTLQVALPGLLGAIAGFIAAAAGSPALEDRPLRLFRTLSISLLAGLACGLVTGLSAAEGVSLWPIASWTRDLLAAGLLMTALHRIIPQRRA